MSLRACLFAAVVAFGAAAIGEGDSEWPWQNWCNQTLLHKNNNTACVVEQRTDLPTLDPDSNYDIHFASHELTAAGSVAEVLSLTHSMILIREVGKPSGLRMVLEYAALYFGPQSLMPTIEPDGTLRWKTDSAVAWFPEANYTDWLAEANVTHVGTASSHVLDQWFEWVPQFRSNNKGYQIWSVWDQSNVSAAQRLLNESICHTFTEEGLTSFHNLGARFSQMQPLCRNYFPFLSDSMPYAVDLENSTVRQHVDDFYLSLNKILRGNFSNLTDFGNAVRSFLSSAADHIYIYQFQSKICIGK